MSETDIILGFVRACASGNLGYSECSPVFVFGGIALVTIIMVITLSVLMTSHAKTQAVSEG